LSGLKPDGPHSEEIGESGEITEIAEIAVVALSDVRLHFE
jgi:hypothetical protein